MLWMCRKVYKKPLKNFLNFSTPSPEHVKCKLRILFGAGLMTGTYWFPSTEWLDDAVNEVLHPQKQNKTAKGDMSDDSGIYIMKALKSRTLGRRSTPAA